MLDNRALSKIREKFGSFITPSCSRDGCSLRTTGILSKNICILDVDRLLPAPAHGQEKPDYFIVWLGQRLVLAIVELKGGVLDAGKVHGQVTSGISIAKAVSLMATLAPYRPELLPLAVYKRGSAFDIRQLLTKDKYRVAHGNAKLNVGIAKCGTHILDAAERAGISIARSRGRTNPRHN